MIEFEVERNLDKKATINSICEYVLETGGWSKDAERWAEKIRRFVLSQRDFTFDEKVLNYLCGLTHTFGTFTSWSDFVDKNGSSDFAKLGSGFLQKPFFRYSAHERQYITSLVERRMGTLYVKLSQEGKLFDRVKRPAFADEEELFYKVADITDIAKIANLAKRVYPCAINDTDKKLLWYQKNSNIFFVCFDRYGELIANLNVLPISEDVYLNLKNGHIYEDEISEDDIISSEDHKLIKYIYIEGFASLSKEAQFGFRSRFSSIISSILGVENMPSLVVCAIGGSIEGDNLMRSYGFKQTGVAVDRKNNSFYPFLENTFKSIEEIINSKNLRIVQ